MKLSRSHYRFTKRLLHPWLVGERDTVSSFLLTRNNRNVAIYINEKYTKCRSNKTNFLSETRISKLVSLIRIILYEAKKNSEKSEHIKETAPREFNSQVILISLQCDRDVKNSISKFQIRCDSIITTIRKWKKLNKLCALCHF